MRYIEAYNTLENVTETHLLHQVFPLVVDLVEEAFSVPGGGEPRAGVDPSAEWAEVLLQRALHLQNKAVLKTYLMWVFAQSRSGASSGGRGSSSSSSSENMADGGEQQQQEEQPPQPHHQEGLDVRLLSEGFVFGSLLPALNEVKSIRGEEREILLSDIGRFLAIYTLGRQEKEGRAGSRRFLSGVLSFTKVSTSTFVRMALLGVFLEQQDILERVEPCFGVAELGE